MSRRRNMMKSFKGEDGIRNFDSTLIALDVIKNQAYITKSEKEQALAMVKGAIDLLSVSIKYKSFKADCEAEGIKIAELDPEIAKYKADDDSLEAFFGKCSNSDMRKQLRILKQKIIEVSKAIE